MAVLRRRRTIRRQITLSPEDDAHLQRLAAERGMAASQIIGQALRATPSQAERIAELRGIVKGGGGSVLLSDHEMDQIICATEMGVHHPS